MGESERLRELSIGVSEERTSPAIGLPFLPGVDTISICGEAMDDPCTLSMIPLFYTVMLRDRYPFGDSSITIVLLLSRWARACTRERSQGRAWL
jgi:hypothetical protein